MHKYNQAAFAEWSLLNKGVQCCESCLIVLKNLQRSLLQYVQVDLYTAEYSAEIDDRASVLIHKHQHQSLWQAGTQMYAADREDAAGRYAASDRVALHHASARCAPG